MLSAGERVIMQEVAQETAERVVKEFSIELKDKIIPEVVNETLSNLGQDTSDKQAAQKDYIFLREARLRAEKIRDWKIKAIVTSAVGVVFAACVAYFKGGNT